MPTITPFLWFDDQLEAAVSFYCSVFGDSAVLESTRYPEGAPGPTGQLMTATFRLAGQEFMGLNGGPHYAFSPATSFFVTCDTQDEVDHLWDALLDGGQAMQCGWLTDRFGVTWQVVPRVLGSLMGDPDPEKSARVVKAMMGMVKLDSAELQRAYDGGP